MNRRTGSARSDARRGDAEERREDDEREMRPGIASMRLDGKGWRAVSTSRLRGHDRLVGRQREPVAGPTRCAMRPDARAMVVTISK